MESVLLVFGLCCGLSSSPPCCHCWRTLLSWSGSRAQTLCSSFLSDFLPEHRKGKKKQSRCALTARPSQQSSSTASAGWAATAEPLVLAVQSWEDSRSLLVCPCKSKPTAYSYFSLRFAINVFTQTLLKIVSGGYLLIGSCGSIIIFMLLCARSAEIFFHSRGVGCSRCSEDW